MRIGGQAARISLKEERLKLNEVERKQPIKLRIKYLTQIWERRRTEVTDPQRLRDIDWMLDRLYYNPTSVNLNMTPRVLEF